MKKHILPKAKQADKITLNFAPAFEASAGMAMRHFSIYRSSVLAEKIETICDTKEVNNGRAKMARANKDKDSKVGLDWITSLLAGKLFFLRRKGMLGVNIVFCYSPCVFIP